MKNLKIRVNSEAESKEAQELFFKLGFQWRGLKSPFDLFYPTSMDNYYIVLTKGSKEMQIAGAFRDGLRAWKEITLPELRAMVNPMKEYLEKQPDGTYSLVLRGDLCKESDILIPEGAEIAIKFKYDPDEFGVIFYKNNGKSCFSQNDKAWQNDADWTMKDLLNENCCEDGIDLSHDVLWQREQDEPFLTPETTLNDQYAEIEQVRQVEIHGTVKAEPDFNFGAAQSTKDNVNHPSHYADSAIECIDAMEAMMTPEQFIGYLRGNLFKYQWRYEKKNGIEDLKKAQWYLEKLTAKVAEKNAPF